MVNLLSAIEDYCVDPENAEKSYSLALEYEKIGQTAAAISYFLRTAERTEDNNLAYECMIKVGNCFDKQGNRNDTVRGIYKHAITISPDRPEAYYMLSKFDNFYQNYPDGYVYSNLGLIACENNLLPLRSDVGYVGKYGLLYEKMVSSWSWGKVKECNSLLDILITEYSKEMSLWHKEMVNVAYNKYGFTKPLSSKKVVDCFTYYDETCKEMLELRYNMLHKVVDKFVVCEANRTQTGEKIPFNLRNTLKDLGIPTDKFIIVELEIPDDDSISIEPIDISNSYQNQNLVSFRARARERMQKNGIMAALDMFDDDTYFIVSDCDEIINPNNLNFVLDVVENSLDKVVKIPLAHLEGKANLRVLRTDTWSPKPWDGAMFICKKQHLLKASVIQIRSNIDNPYQIAYIIQDGKRLEDLGWHFSWMGNARARKKKLNGFVHRNEKLDFLATSSYDSKETLERIEKEPAVGDISVSCESETMLIPYPRNKLPEEIFSNARLMNFFIGEK